jgi:cytochrome c556
MRSLTVPLIVVFLAAADGCSNDHAIEGADKSVVSHAVGSVKDLMKYEVDPFADSLWGAVSTSADASGIHEHQPNTQEEWDKVRGDAVALAESANLLMFPDRTLVLPGQKLEGEGSPGSLTTAAAQRIFEANHAQFLAFAQALQIEARQAVKAAEAKDTAAILESGGALDNICENCHLTFWYPKEAGK